MHEGNTEEEKNDNIVFKWSINVSAGNRVVARGGGEALLPTPFLQQASG
jgi:hypothetical protein